MSQSPCLLAEDEVLIGMAIADMLEEAGIPVAGPFAAAAEALAWARQYKPGAAILDFSLKDGPCTGLARELMAQGIPVIVYSGWPEDSDARPELTGVTWLEKPVHRADLLAALAALSPYAQPASLKGVA